MASLKISPKAQEDMMEIKKYITEELSSPKSATRVLTRITSRLRELIEFPLLGMRLTSIIDIETDYRFLVCGQYIAFYRCEDDVIYVERVLHGRRDSMRILFGDIVVEEDDI